MLPLKRNPNTGSMLLILLLLKTTLVPCRGIYKMTYMSFSKWSSSNGLNLNAKKCQALEINFSRASPQHADLKIGSDKLVYVDKAKILGRWLQNDLKWQTQVDVMLKKANERLFMLRSLKRFGFDQDELMVVYKSYVRPVRGMVKNLPLLQRGG